MVRGAAAAGAAAIAVVLVLTISMVGTPRTESEQPAGTASAGTTTGSFVVHRVGGHDRDHMWMWGEVSSGGGFVMASTSNGGRTWTKHHEPVPLTSETAVDNAGLFFGVTGANGVSAFYRSPRQPRTKVPLGVHDSGDVRGFEQMLLRYTTDSWRTHHDIPLSQTPVARASDNALVDCVKLDRDNPYYCSVTVFDPAAAVNARLAEQPPLKANLAQRGPNGVIWAVGYDPGSARPAAASSADGGRTWSKHVFADHPPLSSASPLVNGGMQFGRNGSVLLQMITTDANVIHVNRFVNDTWQRLADFNPRLGVSTWLTDDGTHVRQEIQSTQPTDGSSDGASPKPMINKVTALLVCPPDRTDYKSTAPPKGFPTENTFIGFVQTLPGGGYLTHNYDGAWFSPNGLTWQRVPSPN
jgi:hypothetical protein